VHAGLGRELDPARGQLPIRLLYEVELLGDGRKEPGDLLAREVEEVLTLLR
jgi:hypothetical protein